MYFSRWIRDGQGDLWVGNEAWGPDRYQLATEPSEKAQALSKAGIALMYGIDEEFPDE